MIHAHIHTMLSAYVIDSYILCSMLYAMQHKPGRDDQISPLQYKVQISKYKIMLKRAFCYKSLYGNIGNILYISGYIIVYY